MDSEASGLAEPNHAVPVDYDRLWSEVYGDMQDHGPTHRHMRRILGKMLRKIEYDSVLEVGCGTGKNLPLLGKGGTVADFAGLDISSEALAVVRQAYDGEFHILDIQQDRLDKQWDLVFCSLVLEHLTDDLAALRNMRMMTKKHLLVTTIAGDFERYRAWDEQVGHVRNYQVGELENKLRLAGFDLQRIIYWGFPFFSPLARTVQNRSKATSKFGRTNRALATLMYYLYFFNSYRKGDLLFALAKASESPKS